MNRRDFLTTTVAAASLVPPLLAAETSREAAASAAGNPISGGGLIYDLNRAPRKSFPGGSIQEQSATDFPASPTMASSLITLITGGVRGFHWHRGGAEYGTVLDGEILLTILDDQNRQENVTVSKGDVYYVPKGFGHSLACLGSTECKVLAVYDRGDTVESNALQMKDWIATQRSDILTKLLGVPGDELKKAADGVSLISLGEPLTPGMIALRGILQPVVNSFAYKMTELAPVTYSGGSFVQASIDQFANSRTMVGAFTRLKPGAVREPHWHPNADEWDFVLQGRARVTVFDGATSVGEVEIGPGQISFLPRYQAHAVETIGSEDFYLYSVFNDDTFQAIDLTPAMMTIPGPILGPTLGLSPSVTAKLPADPRFIYP